MRPRVSRGIGSKVGKSPGGSRQAVGTRQRQVGRALAQTIEELAWPSSARFLYCDTRLTQAGQSAGARRPARADRFIALDRSDQRQRTRPEAASRPSRSPSRRQAWRPRFNRRGARVLPRSRPRVFLETERRPTHWHWAVANRHRRQSSRHHKASCP